MTKRLLVCSVFDGEDSDNQSWLRLQLDYLRRTVGYYFDHAVYLNGANETLFTESIIIGKSSPAPDSSVKAYLEALDTLQRYCSSNTGYQHYLFLDSGCFPFRDGWLELLLGEMSRRRKTFAASARVEALELFPRPIAMLAQDPSLFTFSEGSCKTNLLGYNTGGVVCTADSAAWLPLLRTNRISRNPLIGNILSDIFYFHGNPSAGFADSTQGYYDSVRREFPDAKQLTVELFADPEKYLDELTQRRPAACTVY